MVVLDTFCALGVGHAHSLLLRHVDCPPLPCSPPFFTLLFLLSQTNDSTSWSPTGITGGLTLLMAALAKVVGASMDDDRSTDNALGPNQLDQLIGDGTLGISLAVRLEITQVAHVADIVGGSAVFLAEWVDCRDDPVRRVLES